MRYLLLTLLIAGSVCAQEITLWSQRMPGWRQSLTVNDLPPKLFGTKSTEVAKVEATEDTQLAEAISKVSGLPVRGLVWSKVPQERRVLMGDVTLREGQAIPSYVFPGDARYYTLVEISQANLRFKVQDGAFAPAITFDIPFGLTEPLKNSSSFTSGNAQP